MNCKQNTRKSIYLKEQRNVLFTLNCNKFNDYNKYIWNQIGVNSKRLRRILDFFSGILYIIVCTYTLIFISFCFIYKLVCSIFNSKSAKDYNGHVFLFFTPIFIDRLKSAGLTFDDEIWIVGPNISSELRNKVNSEKIDLRMRDVFSVYHNSLLTLWEYFRSPQSLYPIFKIWEYYEQYVMLHHKLKNCDIYFSNQIDRWALMFDEIEAKSKTLIQHGITLEIPVPYRLQSIDYFYVLSNRLIDSVQNSILNCRPNFIAMKPTIELKQYPGNNPKVLIVSWISNIEFEKQMIQVLSADNKIDIYLKKHPTLSNDKCYRNLQAEYGFTYITEKVFPQVDYVISYYSTLAFEYMAYDIPTYIYPNTSIHSLNQVDVIRKQLVINHSKDESCVSTKSCGRFI